MSHKEKTKKRESSRSKERKKEDSREEKRSERSVKESRSSSKETRHRENESVEERKKRKEKRKEEKERERRKEERSKSKDDRGPKSNSHTPKSEARAVEPPTDSPALQPKAKKRSSKLPVKEESSKKKVPSTSTSSIASVTVVPLVVEQQSPAVAKKPTEKDANVVPDSPPAEAYVYEDDFEDYSDDFEEDTDEESDTLPRDKIVEKARQSEESLILKRLENRSEPTSIPPNHSGGNRSPRITSAQRKIDFSTATVTTASPAMATVAKRYAMLKNLIGIEFVRFEFLDQPTVRDYDFYMEMFGSGERVQTQTQTGDGCQQAVQTEEQELETKWTQHPPNDDLGWGSVVTARYAKTYGYETEDSDLALYKSDRFYSSKLKNFVRVAGQVMLELISSPPEREGPSSLKNRSNLSFSTGYNVYSLGRLANASRVSYVVCNDRRLLVAFFVKESVIEDIINRSLLVEFSTSNQELPQRVMFCASEALCCCYSPDGETAAFAGLADGSCVAFDFDEPSSCFVDTLPWPNAAATEFALRVPSYDTSFRSAIVRIDSNADIQSPIVHIAAVHSKTQKERLPYQIVSINELGTVIIWTVSEVASDTSEFDLGLRPGSKLKLNQTAVITPSGVINRCPMSSPNVLVTSAEHSPLDASHIFIGTDVGFILNAARNRAISYKGPRKYNAGIDVAAEVLAQRFSPFDPTVILAGLSNGQLALYRVNRSDALLTLIPPRSSCKPVTQVEFSPVAISVFYSIHEGSRLLVWDISVGVSPLAVCDLSAELIGAVVSSAAWRETAWTHHGDGVPFLALGSREGYLHVHALEKVSKHNGTSIVNLIESLNKRI